MSRRLVRLAAAAAGLALAAPAAAAQPVVPAALQSADLGAWAQAPYAARLAVSGDIVSTSIGARLRGPSDARVKAEALERCISELSRAPDMRDRKVADIAEACFIYMGWS